MFSDIRTIANVMGQKNLVKKMAKMDTNHLLALIGGIIMVVEAIFSFLGTWWAALIGLILGLLVIASTGIIDIKIKIPFNGIVLLVLAIIYIILVHGWWVGPILVIIAAILLLLNK